MTLALLLILSPSCAAEITQPSVVSDMQLRIVDNGTVESPTFRLEKVAFELLMPQRSENQVVAFDGDVKRDSLGNSWFYMEQRNPPRVFRYSNEFFVNVSEIKTTSIPKTYEIPDEVKTYLKSTEDLQAEDPEIHGLSEYITNNSRTDFERIAALAAWVHDNVVYDRSLRNESKDARWVLENRVGTCDEFATLFIALTRSIGIPARFVAGYYYGNGKWEEHAFSEVYLGEWIPVDPTNLEVGGLDAAHIKFAVSNGNSVGSRIKSYGADAERIDWRSETQIQILNYTENKKLDYELLISSDELLPGDSAVVVLRMKPDEYAFLRASLQPCVSDFPFIELDGIEKDIVLEPGKEKIISWRVDVAEDLKENMRYSCPMVLNSRFLELGEVVLNVDTRKPAGVQIVGLSAELSDSRVGYGRNETVFLHVKDIPESKPVKVGLVSGNYFREFSVDKEENIVVSFKPERLGEQEVLVYSSTGSVLILDYGVVEFEEVYIDHIRLPSVIKAGEEGEAEVLIKNNRPSPQELRLYMRFDSKERIKSLSVENQSVVRIPFKFDEVGAGKITFRLKGADIDLETKREISVYDVPELKVDAVYMPHRRKVVVTLKASRDVARNIEVRIDDNKKSLKELSGEETLEFDMDVVPPEIVVEYEDFSGESYSLQAVVETREEGLLDRIFRAVDDFIKSLIDSF